MQQQGSGVGKTAYQRWKETGCPRPYLREVVAIERFDFFALASLLLALAIMGWWIYSIYKVAFPDQTKIQINYSTYSSGGFIFSPMQTATPTPVPTPTPQPPLWGGPRAGGTLPGGTRPGGAPWWAPIGGGLALFIVSFLTGYSISLKYKIVKRQ